MISLVDHHIGRVLAVLNEEGLLEDTMVVFTSDHGDWLGDHGLVLKGPMLYDSLLRVALIVHGPGIPAGRVIEEPVSSVDLAVTFGDWAGTTVQSAAHGQSLVPVMEHRTAPREHVYAEWKLGPARCGVPLDLRCVRTKTAKLTMELGSGVGEMYDLVNDPHECVDRFNDPACQAMRDDLMQRLQRRPDDVKPVLSAPSGPG